MSKADPSHTTNPSVVDRRAALGIMSMLFGAAATSAAAIAAPASDAAIFDLAKRIKEADAHTKALLPALTSAEERYFASRQPQPVAPPWREGEDTRAIAHQQAEDFAAWKKADADLHDACGVTAAEKAFDDACDVLNALKDELTETEANTLQGIYCKASAALELNDNDMLRSVAADLENVAVQS